MSSEQFLMTAASINGGAITPPSTCMSMTLPDTVAIAMRHILLVSAFKV